MSQLNLARIAAAEGVPDDVAGSSDSRLRYMLRDLRNRRSSLAFGNPLKPDVHDNRARVLLSNANRCLTYNRVVGVPDRHPLFVEYQEQIQRGVLIGYSQNASIRGLHDIRDANFLRADIINRYLGVVARGWQLMSLNAYNCARC